MVPQLIGRLLEITLPHGGLVAMLEAYFDESGSHLTAPVTSVAGYVFESEQYKRFEMEWREQLAKYGLIGFHMSDCAHLKKEFRNLSRKESSELCRSLIGIIKRRIRIGLVVSISEDTLRMFQPTGTPHGKGYVLCLQGCMMGITAWINTQHITDRVAIFFESGHKLQSLANRAMNSFARKPALSDGINYASHTFIGKNDAAGLQAADLLAWEWQAEWRNRNIAPRRSRRMSLSSLVQAPHLYHPLTFDNLKAIHTGVATEESRRFNFIE